MIKKELEEASVEENELDSEVQKELTKLKNEGINQVEVDKIKNKVSDNIKLKKAEKELDNLLGLYQKNLSPERKKELLKKIYSFVENNNSFYQLIYQKRKGEIENLVNQLKKTNSSQQITLVKDNFSLVVKSTFGIYLLTAMAIVFKMSKKTTVY